MLSVITKKTYHNYFKGKPSKSNIFEWQPIKVIIKKLAWGDKEISV